MMVRVLPSRDFIFELLRPAAVRERDSGGCEVSFAPTRTSLGEGIVVITISIVVSLPFIFLLSPFALGIPFVMALFYLVSFASMRDLASSSIFRISPDHHVHCARQSRDVPLDGVVIAILYIDLSGHEDLERTESGSCRLGLQLLHDGRVREVPVFISNCQLYSMAAEISAITGIPIRQW